MNKKHISIRLDEDLIKFVLNLPGENLSQKIISLITNYKRGLCQIEIENAQIRFATLSKITQSLQSDLATALGHIKYIINEHNL